MSNSGGDQSLDALYARAAEATRTGSGGLYFATRHFPLDLERAAHAVYWFCDYTRALGRGADTPEQGRQDLDIWESLVTSGLRGCLARHPVLDVFLDTVDRCAIPHQAPMDLIDGVRLDTEHARYETFSQLRGRLQKVGGVVSQMMAHVIGFRGPALEYMADLGIAVEMTTLLRDTGDQLKQGRIYLPLEDMGRFGYSEASLESQVRDGGFEQLMRFQAARIQDLYARAEPGIALLDARGRFAVRVAFDLYRSTLRRIENSGFDVFRHRAGVPAVERAWITARSMAGPITRRLWRVMSA